MESDRILTWYLAPKLRGRAKRGRFNFINQINGVLKEEGYEIAWRGQNQGELEKSLHRPGYAIFHMKDPFHDRALTVRKVYRYPFWDIVDTGRRWDWPVARAEFAPDPNTPRPEIERFYRYWGQRQFGDAPARARREGYVYVPLQGMLQRHRSFQFCSPLEMLATVLEHDRSRPVVAALHPKEKYDQAELDALDRLAAKHGQLTVRTGGMIELLTGCDYVVTQNSSVGFAGYFFGKPLVLFGRIDFHHIAANVHDLGVAQAMELGPALAPDYAAYVHWFWQVMAINAGLKSSAKRIRDRIAQAGWPLDAR